MTSPRGTVSARPLDRDSQSVSFPPAIRCTHESILASSLRWMSLGLPFIWATTWVHSVVEQIPISFVIGLVVVTSPLPFLHLARRRLGSNWTTGLFLATLLITVLYLESVRGFTPGAALLSNALILLWTLRFGDKTFRWVLLASFATMGLGWLLFTSGIGPPGTWKINDPNSPWTWVRQGLTFAFAAAAFRDMTRDVRTLEQERLLNELGAVLASSLNVHQTLDEVSRRVVQNFADFCVFEPFDDSKARRYSHARARDPGQASLADAICTLPLESHEGSGEDLVWRTQGPEVVEITPEHPPRSEIITPCLAVLEATGARSIARAPMITRGHPLGMLIAVSSSHVYDQQDLWFLVEVATRAAMALENASLHAALQAANTDLQARLTDLQQAQDKIRTLTGLLPVCAWCGRIRDEREGGVWKRFAQYVTDHTAADVSHGICPECAARHLRSPRGRSGVA